ncbi:MAG: iron ABC transporter [Planctomycetaceae bacterium]|nr:iron ABC transporter [Planctomycetaceae bacterium]
MSSSTCQYRSGLRPRVSTGPLGTVVRFAHPFMVTGLLLLLSTPSNALPAVITSQAPASRPTMPLPSPVSISGATPATRSAPGKFARALLLEDYNTRVVVIGTLLLGIGSGIVGTFMLLRKRSLVGDVVSHAALPGIAMAFLIVEITQPGTGRSMPLLLVGALLAGLVGVGCTMAISRFSRIKQDAALAIVLSVFFGLGISLFTIIQKLPTGNVAGLQQFIYGQTASMTSGDVRLIALASLAVLGIASLLFKEIALLCFDEQFARSNGWPTGGLDSILMALVVSVAIIGLQSVGLLLVVALLIIPAASARFWTERLGPMTIIAACFGGLSAWLGAVTSSMFARFSAGPVIVLAGTLFFLFSMTFGTRRGIVRRLLLQLAMRRRVGRHDLARTIYEFLEPELPLLESSAHPGSGDPLCIPLLVLQDLLGRRTWSPKRLGRLIQSACRHGLLQVEPKGWRLTSEGARHARLVARNHRLWETYLILHADVAPSHVDRNADLIEHVLEPELIEQLVEAVMDRYPQMDMPPSPHPLAQGS